MKKMYQITAEGKKELEAERFIFSQAIESLPRQHILILTRAS